jgi:type III secretion system YscQ/HrcQ family protein
MTLLPWLPPTAFGARRDGELWNAALAFAGQPIPLGAGSATVELAAGAAPDPTSHVLLIETGRGPRLIAAINSFPFKALFGADISAAEVQTLEPALRDSLNEGIVALLWTAIPEDALGNFRIVGSGMLSEVSPDDGHDALQWLSLTVRGIAPEPVSAVVGMSMSGFIDAIGKGALARPAIARGLETKLTAEASFTLGSLSLSLAAFSGLAPGDLVVVPDLPGDMALVRVGWTRYIFRRAAEGFSCVGCEPVERYRERAASVLEGTIMNDQQTVGSAARAEDPAGTGLSRLDMVVDFDLSRVLLPLAELQKWQPGTVVALDMPAAADGVEVTIRVNGQFVGTGDLVRVDDRFAVRLTHLTFGR